MTGELIEKGWAISPGSVFGFLIVFMLAIIIVLAIAIRYLYRRVETSSARVFKAFEESTMYNKKLIEMIEDMNDPDKRMNRQIRIFDYMDKKFEELYKRLKYSA